MTALQLTAQLLAADLNARELEYLILPFGEAGSTNLGAVTASAGTLTLPSDPSQLLFNEEHDATRPLGRGVSISETARGIVARFRVAKTTRGDDVLIEAAEGLRTGASVEIDDPVIRAGRLVSGVLTAVAAVVKPAFPSAQLVAADCGDLPITTGGSMTSTKAQVALTAGAAEDLVTAVEELTTETVEEIVDPAVVETTPAPEAAPAVTAARAPLGSQKPQLKATDRKHDVKSVAQMLARAAADSGGAGRMTPKLIAVLSEITSADVLDIAAPDSFEGKIWEGSDYERMHTDLVANEGLSSIKYRGWKWKKAAGVDMAPTMAIYGGFPATPPSNDVEAIEHTWEPGLIAWAGQLDRKYRDFSDAAFWEAFFKSIATSYGKVTDNDVILTELTTAATDIALVGASQPAGVPEGIWKLVKGIRAVIKYGMPTGARLHTDLWEEIMYTPQDQVLPYLQLALGVKDGQALNFTIKPDEEVLAEGDVLVVVKQAATFRELPGASPIRVDAEIISKGGIEQGVFGYAGLEVNEPRAIALVNTAP